LSTDSLRVNIVNKQNPLGRGVEYGTPRPEHLLNVVARNMSAFPDLPFHFAEWLRNRADFADHDQRNEPDWVQETPENLVEYYN
jgi:uncharacterized NAD(P)/FAD-binding protein YdhS